MVDEQEVRFHKITTEPVIGLLFRMAGPTIIGMLVNAVYNMTDTFWIGKLNRVSLTASVGIVFSFVSMVQAIGFWFGYGSGNYMSRQLGQRNTDQAEEMATAGLTLALVIGTLIMCLGLAGLAPLARLLGADTSEEMMDVCQKYLGIILISVPFSLGATTLYNQLRLQGNAKDGMIGLMVGMGINMVLDPILILSFHMGIEGAGLATLLGQVIGFGILLYLTGRHGNVRIKRKYCKHTVAYVHHILAGGAPNFARQGITAIAGVLLNQVAAGYGENAVAAFAITNRIVTMGFALVIGFGQAFQPICAYNYGAGLYDRVKRGFRFCVGFATVLLSVTAIGLFIFAGPLLNQFTNNRDVIQAGRYILWAQMVAFPLLGYYTMVGMLLQNMGRFLQATLVTIAEKGLLFIPAILLLPCIFGWNGVVWAQPTASVLAAVFSFYFGRKAVKELTYADGSASQQTDKRKIKQSGIQR